MTHEFYKIKCIYSLIVSNNIIIVIELLNRINRVNNIKKSFKCPLFRHSEKLVFCPVYRRQSRHKIENELVVIRSITNPSE